MAAVLCINVPLNIDIFGIRVIYNNLVGLLCMFNDRLQCREECPIVVIA